MEFNEETQKVIIGTLKENEAEAFIKFLKSEVYRHFMDINEAEKLIKDVKEKFKI